MQILSHWGIVGRGSGTNPPWLWRKDGGNHIPRPSQALALLFGHRVSWELRCGLSVPRCSAALPFTDDLGRCRLSCTVGQMERLRIHSQLLAGSHTLAQHQRLPLGQAGQG